MGKYAANMIIPSQVVILCGGLGTRLRPYTDSMPKPMIPINGEPFLWHLLKQLSSYGIRRFVLLTGYRADDISDYFGDGIKWGWCISYSRGPIEWDTGRRIWEARDLFDSTFFLLYSDNFTCLRPDDVLATHRRLGRPLTLTVVEKTPGNISIQSHGAVGKYDRTRSAAELNYVEIGYMIVEKTQMLGFFEKPDCSFSDILARMSGDSAIAAFQQQDKYYSISDPDRWKQAEKYLTHKKIILIDRDGVINKKAAPGEYILKWEDFRTVESTMVAMQELARSGYSFIIISNQAGIARKKLTQNQLQKIHQNMLRLFSDLKIPILDIFVCPHHWDDGCQCRKPAPGMFFDASQKHLFRLDQVIFIGDDSRDCEAAYSARCASIFIGPSESLNHLPSQKLPLGVFETLPDAVPMITKFYEEVTKA